MTKNRKILLLAVLLFAFPVFAQIFPAADTLPMTMRFRIRMVGLQVTINAGGNGADRTPGAPTLDWDLSGDTFHVSETLLVNPCDFLHYIYWIENTGSVVLNFDAWDTRAGSIWYKESTLAVTTRCEDLYDLIPPAYGANKYASSYFFSPSDGDSLTPPLGMVFWQPLPTSAGDTREYENLIGEDPAIRRERTWAAQTDQTELHIGLLIPYSVTDTLPQSVIIGLSVSISP